MKDQIKENLLEWVRAGLRLPDIEIISDAMFEYFKDGSEYWQIDESKRSAAQFHLHTLVQSLSALRSIHGSKDLASLMAQQKTAPLVDLREWKNKRHYFRGSKCT